MNWNNVLSDLENQGGYFIDIVSRKGIQAGIIRLREDGNDTQAPQKLKAVGLLK